MDAQPPANKRHLIYSLRRLRATPARATNFEFENAIAAFDGGHIIAPQPPQQMRAIFPRTMRRVRHMIDAAMKAPTCTGEYDTFFFACESLADLYLLGSMRKWRQRCKKTICWINELWANSIDQRKGEMALLAEFDHVFLHFKSSVDPVSKVIGNKVHHFPSAVDTLHFCPVPEGPKRTIDIFNMGRRCASTHEALQQFAHEQELFYLYGIIQSPEKIDVDEYRNQLTDLIQRSRYFVVNKAKVDLDSQTQGQEELAFRFFEGAAAGTVMIGSIPKCSAFKENFDWPDAVIELNPGDTDVASVMGELESDPARQKRISTDNIVNSLRRHDWVHRWQTILQHLDMAPSQSMAQRQEKLNGIATQYNCRAI